MNWYKRADHFRVMLDQLVAEEYQRLMEKYIKNGILQEIPPGFEVVQNDDGTWIVEKDHRVLVNDEVTKDLAVQHALHRLALIAAFSKLKIKKG